ncbi:MAG: recombination mediator RecR [Chitinivibrionales bacterium]|nr:recombination mediator RecR [Chitinivibrionales bacterium]
MVQALEKLVEELCSLPTIGRKSAWRLALFMLERPAEELTELAQSIATIKQKIVHCRVCYNYSERETCAICSSANRDGGLICVVARPTDVFAVERAGRYRGAYHVLGGVLSPINGITADKLRLAELVARVKNNRPHEIILGLGASAEAETTALYCARLLSGLPVRITRLARGLPAGIELEYVDQLTLSQALHERTQVGGQSSQP